MNQFWTRLYGILFEGTKNLEGKQKLSQYAKKAIELNRIKKKDSDKNENISNKISKLNNDFLNDERLRTLYRDSNYMGEKIKNSSNKMSEIQKEKIVTFFNLSKDKNKLKKSPNGIENKGALRKVESVTEFNTKSKNYLQKHKLTALLLDKRVDSIKYFSWDMMNDLNKCSPRNLISSKSSIKLESKISPITSKRNTRNERNLNTRLEIKSPSLIERYKINKDANVKPRSEHEFMINAILHNCQIESNRTRRDISKISLKKSKLNCKFLEMKKKLKLNIKTDKTKKKDIKKYIKNKHLFIYGKKNSGRFLCFDGTDSLKIRDHFITTGQKYDFIRNALEGKMNQLSHQLHSSLLQ